MLFLWSSLSNVKAQIRLHLPLLLRKIIKIWISNRIDQHLKLYCQQYVIPSSFIVKFKSPQISQLVLQTKRSHGEIKYKDLVPNGPNTKILLFELLSAYLNELRLSAKRKATAKGYKSVFESNGCVLVKKLNSSHPIIITTETDLEQIV